MIDEILNSLRDPAIDRVYRLVRVILPGSDIRFMPHFQVPGGLDCIEYDKAGNVVERVPVEVGVTLWLSVPTSRGILKVNLVSGKTPSACLEAVLANKGAALQKLRQDL